MESDGERSLSADEQPRLGHTAPDEDQTEEYWNVDINSPEFAAEARRQSLLVANSPMEKEDMAFIESLANEILASLDEEEERSMAESTEPETTL